METPMRMMLRFTMPVEAGNKAIKDGSLAVAMKGVIDRLKPEASYFFAESGFRSALFVFDMHEPSQIPAIVEPLFLALNASVSLVPVMNAEDLQKGLAAAAKER
jgi:hypothetical protein